MFTGFVLSIPHTLNAIPTGVTIEPGDIDGLNLLSSVPYFITVTSTDININFALGVSVINPFAIFWSVTRN